MKEPILYRLVRPVLKIIFDIIYKPTYIGLENIPKNEKLLIASNHTNNFDCIFLISSTKRVIHFMGKHTLFNGFKKIIFKAMGVISVNRTIKDKKCLDNARDVLMNNKVIGIFPEGTINKTNQFMIPLKMGVIKLAHDTNSMIIPVVINGKYKRKKLIIKYGVPYKLKEDNLENELNKLNSKFIELLEELK